MTSETSAKKDIQKLQRAIVDGLEDVKGQDIVVFDTESLSPLFERVIVASGTSNRQTRALAASVRDAVREAGFDKPRIEGEENGEWIIVDCGAAVAHVMQPVIRQYYRLEEIWGQKPLRLKHGAPKPAQATTTTKTPAAKKAAAKKTAGKTAVAPVSAKTVVRKAAQTAGKAVVAKTAASTAAKKAPVKKTTAGNAKPAVKTMVVKPKSATKPVAKAARSAKPAVKSAAKPAAKSVKPMAKPAGKSPVKAPARKKA
ncbi:ribosome silencing factor [Hydrogenophaga sp. PAMC20947]|uniref:ribosome silencing factor n=1 Tax=Hydrogenophaga sp. PAMC20947 TaxID=2565558 RepID=UPI00109DE10A|nr:ribosome silencing factor [Hydrogenophaga sp. PAMC20947]QCB45339.1 ribosome silencing factor [Hydrogenophaga sp. PAMC20947]